MILNLIFNYCGKLVNLYNGKGALYSWNLKGLRPRNVFFELLRSSPPAPVLDHGLRPLGKPRDV